jgi:glycosyltransferase involved in cell wall biosynthesis
LAFAGKFLLFMKLKILMILHLPPPVHGAAMMSKYLKESSIINNTFSVDYINLSTSSELNDIGKPGFRKLFSSLKLVGQVFSALRRKNYDLCYMTLTSSSPGFYKDFLVVFILKLFRRKIVYHFHNKGVLDKSERWIDDILYRYAFRNTRSILLSPLLYGDLKKYVSRQDVFICANGIPLNGSTRFFRSAKDDFKCKFLFLSHMMVEKGVVTLLDACKVLLEKHIQFECHFVGSWSDISKDQFEVMVRSRQLGSHVFAHGPKYGAEKEDYFKTSDVFVLPTFYRSECFSLVLLEAMSYGLPVVSTFEGAIPDIVVDGETGFVVQQKNSHQLAAKLELLATRPDLRRAFGTKGRTRFEDNFTVKRFEINMESILRRSALHITD